ncbi:hypothetical protein HanRHA438_Chr08g0346901 [Helianthus annuus]|nr:hypothetical protein HanXRQr2_Chr08g0335561 [Helianthus annuus]KAJ0538634.1 hypothetical protein HanHA300_Chr08g0277201 [Helianthus annuus]KAJ0546556.1 hypothetical protein HanIR_Chr08g0362301 [Helianthus annuus]KAJ0553264.1 hypothetical protein HanHA89_Chr08g0294501 [Helianthus annuus]KAJ0722178.1 hypothetical protein HanOQP8_Chr08g0283771 [Helianthus annuus]
MRRRRRGVAIHHRRSTDPSGSFFYIGAMRGTCITKESVTMMSAPNVSAAIPSTVLTSTFEGSVTILSITTALSTPTITRSLALEFDAEMPPGYEGRHVFMNFVIVVI